MKIELVAIRPGKATEIWHNEMLYDDGKMVISLFDFSGLKKDFVVEGKTLIDRECTGICADFVGEPYEILIVLDKEKNIRGYYVNINRPIERKQNKIYVHDLFLDIWVFPDMTWKLLDLDEYEEARAKGLLTQQDVEIAQATLKKFLALLESRELNKILEKIIRHANVLA